MNTSTLRPNIFVFACPSANHEHRKQSNKIDDGNVCVILFLLFDCFDKSDFDGRSKYI